MELYPSWGQGITSQLQGRAYINWRGTSRHISTQRDRPTILPARQLKPSIEFIPWSHLNFFTLAPGRSHKLYQACRLTYCGKINPISGNPKKYLHLCLCFWAMNKMFGIGLQQLMTSKLLAMRANVSWERARMLGTITTWSNLREREGIFVFYWGFIFF